jgi:hypothetical protein
VFLAARMAQIVLLLAGQYDYSLDTDMLFKPFSWLLGALFAC